MIAIDHTLVSDEVLQEAFVCDLSRCKGACCVAGDAGAPLLESELQILTEIYPLVKPYMQVAGQQAVAAQGVYVRDEDGEALTPLIEGKECAYTIFENGLASCAIEKAHKEGKFAFEKPLSCHLYPIRVKSYDGFEAINYHKWEVCTPACELGKNLKTPVYKFLKGPIIRKYGAEYYEQLEAAAAYLAGN